MDFGKSNQLKRGILRGIAEIGQRIGDNIEGGIKSGVSAAVAATETTSTAPPPPPPPPTAPVSSATLAIATTTSSTSSTSSDPPITLTSTVTEQPPSSTTLTPVESTSSSTASITIQSSAPPLLTSSASANIESQTTETSSPSITAGATTFQTSAASASAQSTITPILPLPQSSSSIPSPVATAESKDNSKTTIIGVSVGVSLALVLILLLLLLRRRRQLKDRFSRYRDRHSRGTIGTTGDMFITDPIMSENGLRKYSVKISGGLHPQEVVNQEPESPTIYEPRPKRGTISKIQDLLSIPLRSHPISRFSKLSYSDKILVQGPSKFSDSPGSPSRSGEREASTVETSRTSLEPPLPVFWQSRISRAVDDSSTPTHKSSSRFFSTTRAAELPQYRSMADPELGLPGLTEEKEGSNRDLASQPNPSPATDTQSILIWYRPSHNRQTPLPPYTSQRFSQFRFSLNTGAAVPLPEKPMVPPSPTSVRASVTSTMHSHWFRSDEKILPPQDV